MQHYIQYHNTEAMGYECTVMRKFRVQTSKAVHQLPGNRVWLIAGKGKPRQYTVCYTFIVDEVGPSDHPVFKHYASGTDGLFFGQPVVLNQLPWFPDFLRRQHNFRSGLRKLEADTARALQKACGMTFLPD